ncbi:MAG: heme-binding protein [Polyangia bacterium]
MRRPTVVVLTIVGLAVLLVIPIGWVAVAKVDEPKFVVERKEGEFEVRRYAARVVAETRVVGDRKQAESAGFRLLAGYIFGGNKTKTKIAMTAPVGQSAQGRKLAMTAPVGQKAEGEDAWTVSFTMPEAETLTTLPEPRDARVILRELPPARVAVVKFSGRWTDESFARHAELLRSWLAKLGISPSGHIEVNRYNPPWTLWFMRRNELWLTLDG